jgi:hypothetical protein
VGKQVRRTKAKRSETGIWCEEEEAKELLGGNRSGDGVLKIDAIQGAIAINLGNGAHQHEFYQFLEQAVRALLHPFPRPAALQFALKTCATCLRPRPRQHSFDLIPTVGSNKTNN